MNAFGPAVLIFVSETLAEKNITLWYIHTALKNLFFILDVSKSTFCPERLIIQSKFSDPRKFALRFQYLEIKGVGIKIGNVSMFSDIGGDTLRNP